LSLLDCGARARLFLSPTNPTGDKLRDLEGRASRDDGEAPGIHGG